MCEPAKPNAWCNVSGWMANKAYMHIVQLRSARLFGLSPSFEPSVGSWCPDDFNPEVLAVEMEAAGVMSVFGCATVRGICDYVDSHKNDGWQAYTAAAAAAIAKGILKIVPVSMVITTSLAIFDSADTIDNADDASYIDLNYFLPDAPCVDATITTRSSRAQEMAALEAVKVGDMNPVEAAELLRISAKLGQTRLEVEKEIVLIV